MDDELLNVIFPIKWTPQGLKRIREELRLTQQQAGDIFGVTKVTVKNIECGITRDPMKVFAYGTALERYYAYRQGYLPAYRKEGTNEYRK